MIESSDCDHTMIKTHDCCCRMTTTPNSDHWMIKTLKHDHWMTETPDLDYKGRLAKGPNFKLLTVVISDQWVIKKSGCDH